MRRARTTPSSLLHQPWRDVEKVDDVTALRQPQRVSAGCASDIQYLGRCWRGVPLYQLTGPCVLQLKRPVLEP